MKNLGNMLKEAQKLQSRMTEMQQKLVETEVSGAAGGGMVAVTLNGKGEMRKIKIDPSLAVADEIEILEDLIVAACNDAKAKIDAYMQEEMGKLTGGLPAAAGIQAAVLMASVEIERLVRLLARLPGLGQRSAQRMALAMLKRRDTLMLPLAEAMAACAERVHPCPICGNLDTRAALRDLPRPRAGRAAALCRGRARGPVGAGAGRRHLCRPLPCARRHAQGAGRHRPGAAGRRPPAAPCRRAGHRRGDPGAGRHCRRPDHQPLPGRAPAAARLHGHAGSGHGVPVGGELTYLDEGTLDAALRARQRVA